MDKKMKYLVAALLSFASGAVLLKVFMDKAKKSGEWYAQCPLCGQAHKSCCVCPKCGHLHACQETDKVKD